MWASLLCALHCAAWPLALLALPATGLAVLPWGGIDQAFVVFATVLGLVMVSVGFRRHHGYAAWGLLLTGLALVWAGVFTALHEHALVHALMMVLGGSLIAAAHLVNRRAARRHGLD